MRVDGKVLYACLARLEARDGVSLVLEVRIDGGPPREEAQIRTQDAAVGPHADAASVLAPAAEVAHGLVELGADEEARVTQGERAADAVVLDAGGAEGAVAVAAVDGEPGVVAEHREDQRLDGERMRWAFAKF